jgi:hypothetical protein
VESYKKSGKWGKLKGFEYYLRSENKIRPNQREDFLIKSEGYIGIINEISTTQYPYMDSSMSDIELMEIWNDIYHQWGWAIDEFRDRWVKEKLTIEKVHKGGLVSVNVDQWWKI